MYKQKRTTTFIVLFKKYPYYGWLLVAILCWSAASVRFYTLRQKAQPEAMAKAVSKDLQKRQTALDKFLVNEDLVKRMFADSLTSDEVDAISIEPFYVYAFIGDLDLLFWNNNTVVGTCSEFFPEENNSLYRNNGIYFKQCIHPNYLLPNEHLVILFPISNNYALQNEYLRSSFAAASYIPSSTIVTEQKTTNNFSVVNGKGRSLFYLDFEQQDIPKHIPDLWMSWLLIASILSTLLWLHLLAISLAQKGFPQKGLILILISIASILLVSYSFGIPFHFNQLFLFSPSLYASSQLFPSLGMLLIVLLCLLWLMIFLVKHFNVSYSSTRNTIFKYLSIACCVFLITACAIVPVGIIRSLVLDSQISFNVDNFISVNYFTIIGLFTVVVILCCNTFLIYFCNFHLDYLLRNRVVKYAIIALSITLYFLFTDKPIAGCEYLYAVSVFVFLLLFDYLYKTQPIKVFTPTSLLIGMLMTLSGTTLLHHFNNEKNESNQKSFAEKIVRQRDEMLEFLFKDVGDSIAHDGLIQTYFNDAESRDFINEHIATKYLRGPLNKYQTTIYFYAADGKPLNNTDTTSLYSFDSLLLKGVQVIDYLYHFENAKDARYYIAKIPMDSSVGTMVLSLQQKKIVNASVYPELLQPERLRELQTIENYTYGIYAKRELISQSNDHPFPIYLRSDTMRTGGVRVIKREGYNVNIYKVEEGKRVAIIDTQQPWLEIITLFSYLLGILMVCALTSALLSLYFRYVFNETINRRIVHLTLRNRIHFAMLSVVMLSFLILGAVTIWVFVDRYDNNNKVKLRTAMQNIERSVQQYLQSENTTVDSVGFHEATLTGKFKSFIADLASSEKLDINVYNSFGSLNATSQEDIYNKALLARIMMPEAYYKLSDQQRTLLVEEERIGRLKYLSSYVPVRNIDGQAVGYINVPFFSSQKELNYQISNILVALINLYAFIFLLSSVLAVGITNWLTKGLQVLIDKFKTFDLKENEKIAWDYDDEIGLLLKEYNKMVEKVVENAKRLAQSERESAWREMAKQVAHEIKNPLTPMKLNIQYLQQAIEKGNPNIEQLTQKVSSSLIEQIDSLSYIASAFSDFAKMPEATPELVVLNDVLKNAVQLFNNGNASNVQYLQVDQELISYVDKSQLIRVFNNLLKNATEAIVEERESHIIVNLRKENDKAIITIQDNGTGISDEVSKRIFSPYFTTKSSGTGLGLAMTKKIVEFWNGKIWFETEANVGTIFFIELPLREK